MTDKEELLIQKYVALVGWAKHARDRSILGDTRKAKETLALIRKCLEECEALNND